MIPQSRREICPLYLRHYSPKVMRANSFLRRSRSLGSVVSESRFASAKNRSFSLSFDSRPASIKSTRTRLALVFRILAIACTCLAMRCGSETLCRTAFSILAITVILHHYAPLCTTAGARGPALHLTYSYPPVHCAAHPVIEFRVLLLRLRHQPSATRSPIARTHPLRQRNPRSDLRRA